jgi:hypothetical protein
MKSLIASSKLTELLKAQGVLIPKYHHIMRAFSRDAIDFCRFKKEVLEVLQKLEELENLIKEVRKNYEVESNIDTTDCSSNRE